MKLLYWLALGNDVSILLFDIVCDDFLPHCRCFTFGIGSGASTALVNGLAKAGNGTAEFIQHGERMQPKVNFFLDTVDI